MAYEFGQSAEQPAQQQTPAPAWAAGVASIMTPLAVAGSQVAQTKLIADANIRRAKMGLPPVQMPGGDVPPTDAIQVSEGPSLTPLLVVGGIALVGWLLYSKYGK